MINLNKVAIIKPEITHNKNGDKEWHVNGLLHREDGPAIEYENGDKGWYLRGLEIKYNKETWDQKVNESDVEHIMNK